MLAILLRNPFIVAGGRRSPCCTFLRLLLYHESISKPFSTSPSPPNSDLAVSFFKTSCGLSPSAALAAASKINMKTTENAESILNILETHGFSKPSIALIAAKFPAFFNFTPEKCIKTKLDLFIAAGFTENLIVDLFSKTPELVRSNLERKLRPNLHLLMNTLGGDSKVVATTITKSSWILGFDLEKTMLPNIETLRDHGVADPNIAKLIRRWPRAITQEPDRFRKTVAFLENLGFDPSKVLFIGGIQVKVSLSQPTWERKLQIYRSLGWSEEEILSAFKRNPMCMLSSEEKVRKIMAFFIEKLKWEPSRLALMPHVLCFSFEKRIVPRYAAFNILSMSGLSTISFLTLIIMAKSIFLKYLCKYSDAVPGLLEAYKVKLDSTVAVPSKHVF